MRHPIYFGFATLTAAAALVWSPLAVSYSAAVLEEDALAGIDTGYDRYRRCTPDRIVPGDRLLSRP